MLTPALLASSPIRMTIFSTLYQSIGSSRLDVVTLLLGTDVTLFQIALEVIRRRLEPPQRARRMASDRLHLRRFFDALRFIANPCRLPQKMPCLPIPFILRFLPLRA